MTTNWKAQGALIAALSLVSLSNLAACGGSRTEVRTSSADVSHVVGHSTYVHETVAAPAGYSATERSALVLQEAWTSVDAILQGKGYTLAPADSALMIVRVAAGVKVVHRSSPGGNIRAGGDATETDDVSTLIIDLVDRKSGEILYNGVAERDIHTNKVDPKVVANAVGRILNPIPNAQAVAATTQPAASAAPAASALPSSP